MSIQGPLDINKGISLDIPQIPGWKDIPIVDMLKKRYDVPTFIGHDPDCILSYQLFIDKENSEENCILIRIGNDIGISLMDKGKISLLSHDSSIEIGHAIMVPNGELCRCGKRGCYDMYCSFYGFRTKFEKLMGKKYGYDEMLDYISKSKNKDVQELLLNHEDNIALMLYNMMLMYNTKTFYIEGDILRVDKDFKAKLINKLSEYNEEIDAFFIDTDVSIPPLGAIIYSSDRWAQDAFYRAMYE